MSIPPLPNLSVEDTICGGKYEILRLPFLISGTILPRLLCLASVMQILQINKQMVNGVNENGIIVEGT